VILLLKGKMQWVMGQTLLWKILMKYKLGGRGIEILDLASEVSLDIVVEPPVILGKVIVGNNVTIGKNSYVISGILYSNISIGRYCSISYNVLVGLQEHSTYNLTTSPFGDKYYKTDYYKKMIARKTRIGNDVWIGANVIIRRGVTIADGAVVGAGAVVLNNVPAYSIVAGVPAKIIKYRFNEETVKKLLVLKWWEIDETILKSLDFSNIEECIDTLKQIRKH
jgi:virginiamycin A acetyltransferase